jgi:hypothetical protein
VSSGAAVLRRVSFGLLTAGPSVQISGLENERPAAVAGVQGVGGESVAKAFGSV